MNTTYLQTARLLTQVAPWIFTDGLFALKGGTAINLFVRDLPRLSVDLDLVFVNHFVDREQALVQINQALQQAALRLKARGFQTYAPPPTADSSETKLLVRRDGHEVKIEVNVVMRGTVRPVQTASLTPHARDTLMADIRLPIVSVDDLYGSKLVAALDRQHPRDLFDVKQLFAHGGISAGIRQAFVIYLACHNRPIHEVLFPSLRDLRQDYERTFQGMTAENISLNELLSVRTRLMQELPTALSTDERAFLIALAQGKPQWHRLDVPHASELPALRWKLMNLETLARQHPTKFRQQAQMLMQRFQTE